MMRPGTHAPDLKVNTLGGSTWSLKNSPSEGFSLLVFYRGLHCPICKDQLQSLSKLMNDFKENKVTNIMAISADSKEKAQRAHKDWKLDDLQVGYDLSLTEMTEWGLFISESIDEEEPKYFNEPGLFLVDTNKKLFYCSTSSMPFARPSLKDLLEGLKHINDGYPNRGSVSYSKALKIDEAGAKNIVDWKSEVEMADNHIVTKPQTEKEVPSLKE